MASFDNFEIDIVSALAEQLISSFEKLEVGSLSEDQVSDLQRGRGVYQLFHNGVLVYVGKSNNLPKRLSEHYRKISSRKNISVSEIGFKCLYVHPNWTALAPETTLIRHYKNSDADICEWNGNGLRMINILAIRRGTQRSTMK